MSRITALRAPFRGSRRREIFLDGEKWDDTSTVVIRALGLAEDDDVEPDVLLEHILTEERSAARERALRLLGYREHGSAELRSKLLDDGYHTETADPLCASFVEMGLLDDERYASILARTLITGRRLGRPRARREMIARGIPEEVVDNALDTCCCADDEYDRAVDVARRWYRPGVDRRKLAARLLRRGYPSGICFRAAAFVCEERGDATDDDSL